MWNVLNYLIRIDAKFIKPAFCKYHKRERKNNFPIIAKVLPSKLIEGQPLVY